MHGRAVSGAHDQPIGADQGFVKVWQAAVLSLLLTHEKINQDRVNMLNSWKHSGFSIDSSTRILGESDREALGQQGYIVRGATCAEKISYDVKTDTVTWTASPKGFYKGKKEHFRSFEFMDQLMAHLPPRLQGRAQQTESLRPGKKGSACPPIWSLCWTGAIEMEGSPETRSFCD
jgi:hypothetical protein